MIEIAEKWNPLEVDTPTAIRLQDPTPEIVKIIRLLCGTACLIRRVNGMEDVLVELDTNFINPSHQHSADNLTDILDYFFDERPDDAEILQIFQAISTYNRKFYVDIRNEISYCLFALSSDRATEAFLFLYRVLERLSSACPLIYISRERDFRTAHSFLAGIFTENKTPGELALLQSFIKNYADSEEMFRENSIDFAIEDLASEPSQEMIRQWKNVIRKEVPHLIIDEDLGVITCKFKDAVSLIVTIRNRCYHNKSAHVNFNLTKIGGSEPLFKMVMPKLMYWFSYLFIDFAKWQITAAQR
ncbi:hypothetical protein [Sphingobium yanoikuyae]|uniref:Uncharacterized protein n=1 Tax=Sphingobium yanoikuyae TaxID=13690 RepID=A0A3G2USD7_SPHYA|nr:hypothetical protein [Sphingobium yanoikuyae]AYO77454.1 hypothetical protein EBF16_11570 [Sphingobium yanoikuyae]